MKAPVRTCAGCGAKRPKSEMIRIGAGGLGVQPDPGAEKVRGRGTYLCPRKECLLSARRSGALPKRLREKVSDELYGRIETAMETRQKESIG